MTTIAAELAQALDAWKRCIKDYNVWSDKWQERIEEIMDNAPSGSGIDCGTKLDWEKSTDNKLVFDVSFHHMDEHGMYCGWTEHTIRVYPHLYHGITLTISGRNRNEIKSYLYEIYDFWLQSEAE